MAWGSWVSSLPTQRSPRPLPSTPPFNVWRICLAAAGNTRRPSLPFTASQPSFHTCLSPNLDRRPHAEPMQHGRGEMMAINTALSVTPLLASVALCHPLPPPLGLSCHQLPKHRPVFLLSLPHPGIGCLAASWPICLSLKWRCRCCPSCRPPPGWPSHDRPRAPLLARSALFRGQRGAARLKRAVIFRKAWERCSQRRAVSSENSMLVMLGFGSSCCLVFGAQRSLEELERTWMRSSEGGVALSRWSGSLPPLIVTLPDAGSCTDRQRRRAAVA